MPTRRDLAELRPNPRNPRTISEQKRAMLRDALARFGDLGGIVFNRRSGQLVGGHQRTVAFTSLTEGGVHITRTLPEPAITGTVAEGYVDMMGERFSYREVDWDEATEKAANIAANKGAGDWNVPQLKDWLVELETQDFSLDLTMFDADERAALGAGAADDAGDAVDDDDSADEVPESPPEPTTRLGDVYVLGAHRLACGDFRNAATLSSLFGGVKPTFVCCDPPYGMNLKTQFSHFDKQKARKDWNSRAASHMVVPSNDYLPVHGDQESFDARGLIDACGDCRETFLWGADYYRETLPSGGSWLVWDKRATADGGAMKSMFSSAEFELCWTRTPHRRAIYRQLWMGFFGREKEGRQHPTQKPVKLIRWVLDTWARPGDVVVDLCGGSGTTLIASQLQKLPCLMLEIMPAYCDVIIARWEKMTGEEALLVERDGQPVSHGTETSDA